MNLEKTVRKMGKIVGRGLAVGGLLVALSGFADANLPKVHADDLLYFQIGCELGDDCCTLGYDVDWDGIEDVKFHYVTDPITEYSADTYLNYYAIDLDLNGYFDDGDWFEYEPGEADVNEKKEFFNINVGDLWCYQIGCEFGDDCVSLEYLREGKDGWDWSLFHYITDPVSRNFFETYLDSYAIDKNKDGKFNDNEWGEYY